jgi:hypothetical protein
MFALVEMADTYGNEKLSQQFQSQMNLLGLKMPLPEPEFPEEDSVPDSLRDTAE